MNFNSEKMVIRTRVHTNFYRKNMPHFLRFMAKNVVKKPCSVPCPHYRLDSDFISRNSKKSKFRKSDRTYVLERPLETPRPLERPVSFCLSLRILVFSTSWNSALSKMRNHKEKNDLKYKLENRKIYRKSFETVYGSSFSIKPNFKI